MAILRLFKITSPCGTTFKHLYFECLQEKNDNFVNFIKTYSLRYFNEEILIEHIAIFDPVQRLFGRLTLIFRWRYFYRRFGDLSKRSWQVRFMASHRAVPQPFTGRISPADAARGARVTQADALRLIEDAKLLLQAARFPTAAMVAVMALDEMSRVFQVLTLSTIDGSEQLVAAWKEFRGDRRTFPWSMIQPVEGEDSARPMGDPELAGMLSFIRKLGSRADFIQPGLWVDPAELVSAELAASIVASVESICVAIEPDSLELWSEALRSLPRNATAGMALARYRAMLETAGFAQSAANTGDRRRNSGGAVRRARPLDAFAAARRR